MTDFERALEFIMKWEGGDKITEDPIDPGGLTKYGISKSAHPDVDIRNLTFDQAKQIYLDHYWKRGKCDLLPKPLNIAHMDACVNTGKRRAAKFLQRAVGVYADGVIGPTTLGAVRLQDPGALAVEIIHQRNNFYEDLATNSPPLKKFLKGWLNRTEDLMKVISATVP